MACVEDCSEAAWRYLGAIVLRPTRTSWYGRCDCRDCLEARRLHHDIAEHVRRRDAKEPVLERLYGALRGVTPEPSPW